MFKNETLNKTINKVIKDFETSWEEIQGPRRTSRIVEARFICYKLSREFTNLSYTQISYVFNKDHTSIMNGISRLDKDLSVYENYKTIYCTYLEDTEDNQHPLEVLQRNSVLNGSIT